MPLVVDRALVEITDESGALACRDCRRILDGRVPEAWPITFGIAASDATLRVRARLYAAAASSESGAPDPMNTLDSLVLLRGTPGPVSLSLTMDCYGIASDGSTQSCRRPVADAAPGTGDASITPGAWSLAVALPCVGPSPDGMTCAAGGPFFLRDSDPTVPGLERLVHVSPFFIDLDEMSVGRARALIASSGLAEPRSGGNCHYLGKANATNDEQALNCVSADLASALCVADGKRLPTEAELGYVLANGGMDTAFPWGNDDDVCGHAVVARSADETDCLSAPGRATLLPGPIAVSSPTTDVTVSPPGIRNLAGNMSEWVADTFEDLTGPCWTAAPSVFDNPLCASGGDPMLRGGAWDGALFTATAGFRSSVARGVVLDDTGVRCVQSARDANQR